MSRVYKPIDLVTTENDYKAYAVVNENGKVIYLNNSQELKELFEECPDNKLSIYTLQSVVRAENIPDYNDDYDYDDDEDEDNEEKSIEDVIDEVTETFSNTLKEIVSKLK